MARFGRKDVTELPDEVQESSVESVDYSAADAPAPAAYTSFDNMVFEDSDGPLPARSRKTKPNPFTAVVANSLETGKAKRTPPLSTDEHVKDVTGLLRRAAADAGHGIEIRPVADADGTVLHFQSKAHKRSRSYTVADVREWASAAGYSDSDLLPRVKPQVSDAYREAHGMKTNVKPR